MASIININWTTVAEPIRNLASIEAQISKRNGGFSRLSKLVFHSSKVDQLSQIAEKICDPAEKQQAKQILECFKVT